MSHTTLPPRQADTLPRGERSGRRDLGRGMAALIGSLLLLVGVPVALSLLVGNPLPTSLPSRDWVTAEVTPELVIKLLAVLLWVAWAHFVVCFLAEWRAVRQGRMPSQVGLGGGSQAVARRLVAGLLLLSGGATIAQGASALTMPAAPPAASATATAGATAADPIVGRPGTSDAGVPSISPEQAQQVSRENARELARKHYEVVPPEGRHHDTLWDIADRTLGDPMRYREVYELNKDRLQPDGRRLTDADLIQPGWHLVLPGDAKGPGVRLTPAPGAPLEGTRPAPAAPTVFEAPDAVSADRTADAPAQADHDTQGDHARGLGEIALGGALVLAGIARALTAHRGPFGAPAQDASALAAAGAARRARFVDQALRSLAEMRRAQGSELPEVLLAYAGEEQLVLHLASAEPVAPEEPWRVAEEGKAWTLRREDLVAPSAGTAAPYPSLVTLAESHGYDLLVDLEAAPGLLALTGHDATCREVAMSMAADLATHSWSDRVQVVMVGFGDGLGDLAGTRIRTAATADQALAELGARGSRGHAATSIGLGGVLSGRLDGHAGEHTPTVLILSGPPTTEQTRQIAELTGSGRTAVSVVAVGNSPGARWRVTVAESGALELSALGLAGTARRITPDAQASLLEMVRQAQAARAEGERMLEEDDLPALAARVFGADAEPVEPADTTTVAAAPRSSDLRTASSVLAGATRLPVAQAPVRVTLLGPVSVEAPGEVDAARRDQLTEAVVMAALHPEGLHEAVLKAGLWPRGVDEDVMDARLADAQAWLGEDAEGRSRLSFGADGRWHLSDEVGIDHADLVRVAAQDADDLDAVLGALRAGTGEVFSGVSYGWLAFAREGRDARLLVTKVALHAADLGHAQDRHADELAALQAGCRLVPTAQALWRARLRFAATHAPDDLAREVDEMYSVLDQHGVGHEPETEALVAELLPGRGRAAG